ncbi:hypothetical protein LWI29_035134 [Acer saccharum]|uniref:serine O-acetyltransferase n=1 Tax=Acer saccharum TaxID=4024 RepID=A0AA39SYJ3_ACESA|nr:hypothetical protein LWI29_035134 [Acer saccharum]
MAACTVDNSGAETAKRFCSLESKQCLSSSTSFCRFVKLCKPSFSNLVLDKSMKSSDNISSKVFPHEDDLWFKIREEAQSDVKLEPILLNYYCFSVLSHNSLESALANHLAMKLSNPSLSTDALSQLFLSIFNEDHHIRKAIRDDLKAARERDPACISYVHCLLNFKGFLACQAYRVAHKLWSQQGSRTVMALLIQSRISDVFAVDIHPGAKIGRGIVIDHATGVVIGATAVIGDNVTILHNVTLGGTGKVSGDRHPKIGNGVLLGAGTKVLGNIRIGDEAKIGASSVVLKEVPPRSTAVGNPARLLVGAIV